MIEGHRRYTRWYPTKLAAATALGVLAAPEVVEVVEPVVAVGPTLADAVNAFIIDNGVEASTRGSYEFALSRYIGPELGGTPIADITMQNIATLYRNMANSGRALSVIRQTRAVIYGGFQYAVAYEWINRDISRGIKMPTAYVDDAEAVVGYSSADRRLLLNATIGTR